MKRHYQFAVHFGTSYLFPIPLDDGLESLIIYREHLFRPGGLTGVQSERDCLQVCELKERNGEQILQIPTGSVPRLVAGLQERGHVVTITDHRQFDEPERFREDDAVVNADNREFLRAVQRSLQGVIELRDTSEVIERMISICRFYSEARVLIPTVTKSERRMICREFRKQFGAQVQTTPYRPTGLRPSERTILICSQRKVSHKEHWSRDVILIPEVSRLIGQDEFFPMRQFGCQRGKIFGFVPPNYPTSQRERVLSLAIFGDVIYRDGSEFREVRVAWLRSPDSPKPDDSNSLAFKRSAYWHNDRRNDFITAVAKAYATADQQKLRKRRLPFPVTPKIFESYRDPLVVILVESTEHGRELAKRLPNWQFTSAYERSSVGEKSPGFIITMTAVREYRFPADVVIHASGGTGECRLPGFPAKLPYSEEPPAVLVDFIDQGHPKTRQQTESRANGYMVRSFEGWDHSEALLH